MNILHSPHDPLLEETLRHLAQYALEAPQSNWRIQAGRVTVVCTSDAEATEAVSFDRPFRQGGALYLLISKNPEIVSSVVTESYSGLTESGFTAQVYTSSNQNVDITYLAIGQV